MLFVEGRLKMDQWEDKNTKEKRSKMKVVLEQFEFLSDGRGGGGGGGANSEPGIDQTSSPERHSPPPRASGSKPASQENLDEDVPF